MTTRRHRLDDVAQMPRRLHHPRVVAVVVRVVVRVCRGRCVVGGQSRLLVVVAVGEMLGAAGTVGVDGGGWEGRIVGCLFVVDDNKSSVGVCRRSLWVYCM